MLLPHPLHMISAKHIFLLRDGPKFNKIHCSSSHNTDECCEVLKMVKKRNSIRHIESSHALANAANSKPSQREINIIIKTHIWEKVWKTCMIHTPKYPRNVYLKNSESKVILKIATLSIIYDYYLRNQMSFNTTQFEKNN